MYMDLYGELVLDDRDMVGHLSDIPIPCTGVPNLAATSVARHLRHFSAMDDMPDYPDPRYTGYQLEDSTLFLTSFWSDLCHWKTPPR